MPTDLTPAAARRGISRVSVFTESSEPWFSPTNNTSCFVNISSIGAPHDLIVSATFAATPPEERGTSLSFGGPRASGTAFVFEAGSAASAAGRASEASAGAGARTGADAAAKNAGAARGEGEIVAASDGEVSAAAVYPGAE